MCVLLCAIVNGTVCVIVRYKCESVGEIDVERVCVCA